MTGPLVGRILSVISPFKYSLGLDGIWLNGLLFGKFAKVRNYIGILLDEVPCSSFHLFR